MILQIHFTEAEIMQFFEANGYKTKPMQTGYFAPAYHNRDEWIERDTVGVEITGRTIEAEKLFKVVAESYLKSIVAPTGHDTRQRIKTIFKKHFNE